ncbi:hypothetical protein AVEN_154468-1 [Araneus ventricosus]|uniref:Uncharacterized protein n=1 Tax=Araneus ventricosus TaxID=182803 RepID=A0A4Y2R012_ARAVE|nr:hypothetical protein AVEN_154468-1 [Araneus ventricosus]
MSNLREQEMCIIGKVLDDHRSQTKLFTEEGDVHTLNSHTKAKLSSCLETENFHALTENDFGMLEVIYFRGTRDVSGLPSTAR